MMRCLWLLLAGYTLQSVSQRSVTPVSRTGCGAGYTLVQRPKLVGAAGGRYKLMFALDLAARSQVQSRYSSNGGM
jgi:hypothetical protein